MVDGKIPTLICKKTLSQKVESSISAVFFVVFSTVCTLSLLFLSHSNRVATKGHRLVQLRMERDRLITENEVLGMKIANLQRLERLETDEKILKMVSAQKPRFIRGDSAVAQNSQKEIEAN